MARGTMHQPKPEGVRRNRTAPSFGDVPLARDNVIRGPELAEIADRTVWMSFTLKWWDTWRRSPQAAVFEETDWMRLALLARVVDQCAAKPSAVLMGEIRMNEERLGATVVDRQRARMKITDEAPAEEPNRGRGNVTSIADRLNR